MEKITVTSRIANNVATIWNAYNSAEDIMQWNQASADWQCINARNDLRIGGKFSNRMEAKDGSFGFDFEGQYTAIEPFKRIAYTMPDGRLVDIHFHEDHATTDVKIVFDAESENTIDMQRDGWQSILDNFKSYVERVYGNAPS